MNLNEYLQARQITNTPHITNHLHCRDGFSIYVHASDMHYSSRGENGQWDTVECGFPNSTPELIMDFAVDKENPTETIYSFVPIALVEQLIDLHGGQSVIFRGSKTNVIREMKRLVKNHAVRFLSFCAAFALLVIPVAEYATVWTAAVIVTASALLTYMTRESP